MVYFIKISEDTLHLAAHDPVFVPRLIIGARVKAAAQKTHHLILVQIHFAHITLIILIIGKIGARLTVCHFNLHSFPSCKIRPF